MHGPWRGRLPLLVLVLVVIGGIGLFAAAGSEGTLSYYRTPSELAGSTGSGTTVRLGGLVVDGSVQQTAGRVTFAMTDGRSQVDVVVDSVPPSTFRAGQGAVVSGTLGSDGVFHGRSVVVRHDNQYEPSEMLSR
jgi:cytochrome c-type biogenesis protein CcmE